MPVKDGGQAFPRAGAQHKFASGDSDFLEPVNGMSLRDYFAAEALRCRWPGQTLSCDSQGFVKCEDASTLAANCYAIADAMLAEREK